MRSRMLLAALPAGMLVVGAALVAPSGGAARLPRRTAHVKLKLPMVDHSQVTAVTVKATAPKGQKVGSLKVRTTNGSQLPNISAIYITQAPRKHSRYTTFKFFLVVKRFPQAQAAARAATAEQVDVAVDVEALRFHMGPISPTGATCDILKGWDGLFESGTTTVNTGGRTFTLVPAQSKSRQSTKPEGVLDSIIADLATKRGCTFKPEDYDPGAT